MQFPQPLEHGVLVQRYKRFFADVVLDGGRELTAHCPNPGSMLGLNSPGSRVWLSRSDSPTRKLAHTLELVEAEGALVGVNTMLPNRLAADAVEQGLIPELAGYESIRREVAYGAASRADFRLEASDRPSCWLEVKSVTLARCRGLAEFPDCVSVRALKHLHDLAAEVAKGNRAVLLFVIQRGDCQTFEAAADIDPAYAAGLRQAARAGVEVLCYDCDISPEAIRVSRFRPWRSALTETA